MMLPLINLNELWLKKYAPSNLVKRILKSFIEIYNDLTTIIPLFSGCKDMYFFLPCKCFSNLFYTGKIK